MENKSILVFVAFVIILVIFTAFNFVYLPKRNIISNVETLPEVQAFLEQSPNAKIETAKWDNEDVADNINEIRNFCEELPVESYWKAVVKDVGKGVSLIIWINPKNYQVVCIFHNKEDIEKVTPPGKEKDKTPLVGNNFQVSAPLASNAMSINSNSIQMEIRNGLAEKIYISKVEISGCGEDDNDGNKWGVTGGTLQSFTISCSPPLNIGGEFEGDVTISYTTSGSSVTQQATGTISGLVKGGEIEDDEETPLVGNNFQISAPLAANAESISASNIQLEVRNGLAETMTITLTNITACNTRNDTSLSVASGALQAITVPCSNLASGDRVNGDVTVSYTTSGSSVTQSATGSITGRVP